MRFVYLILALSIATIAGIPYLKANPDICRGEILTPCCHGCMKKYEHCLDEERKKVGKITDDFSSQVLRCEENLTKCQKKCKEEDVK